jgi:hypothetical protein
MLAAHQGSFGVFDSERLRLDETVLKIVPATRQNSVDRANSSQLAQLGELKKGKNLRGILTVVERRISV